MRDPHVESLRYDAEPISQVSYENPQSLEHENDLCTLTLADGILFLSPKSHFATVREARSAIEPFLRAWELDADLRWGLGTIKFKYKDHTIVNRNPPQPGEACPKILHAEMGGVLVSGGSVSFHVTRVSYPKPPSTLQLTPDVETMWLRYRRYLEGREPLLAMAYFCLTVVEASAGGRNAAARQYGVDKQVLSKLGDLTAKGGDAKTARKLKKGQSLRSLLGAEQAWLEEVVKALIRKLGEHRPGTMTHLLSMRDLPSL